MVISHYYRVFGPHCVHTIDPHHGSTLVCQEDESVLNRRVVLEKAAEIAQRHSLEGVTDKVYDVRETSEGRRGGETCLSGVTGRGGRDGTGREGTE